MIYPEPLDAVRDYAQALQGKQLALIFEKDLTYQSRRSQE